MVIKKLLLVAMFLLLMVVFSSSLVFGVGVGGTITYTATSNIHTFMSNGSFNWSGSDKNISILIVGGGACGGCNAGGAGGAGGLLFFNENYSVSAGVNNVTVGSACAPITCGGSVSGLNGSSSKFNAYTALGGGGGGSGIGDKPAWTGGSGGGGGGWTNIVQLGAAGTAGQGFGGGQGDEHHDTSNYYSASGGGGGANNSGSRGVWITNAGNGGGGLNFSINGSNACYSAGGGGARYDAINTPVQGLGGSCAGGSGSGGNGNNANDGGGNASCFGCGGGGEGYGAGGKYQGKPMQGIIIISYSSDARVSFIEPTPASGSHNNTQVNLSINCTSSGAGVTFNLYFSNDTGIVNKVIDNSSVSSWITNVTVDDDYFYNAYCCLNGDCGFNSSVYNWTYDTTAPALVLGSCNEFDVNNVTIRSPFDSNISLCFNLSDTNGLYGYEFLIINNTGVVVYNNTNTSLGSVSTLVFNNWTSSITGNGVYHVNMTVTDTHTSNIIENYQVSSKKSSITFKPANANNIMIQTDSVSDITASKIVDRYNFQVAFSDGLVKNRTFHVKTDLCPLQFFPKSKYKAHFVTSCGVNGGNWIDFEGLPGSPLISKVDDYHYIVTFVNPPTMITFNSIGGLNSYKKYGSFAIGSVNYGPGSVNNGDLFSIFSNFSTQGGFLLGNLSLNLAGTFYNPACYNSSLWTYCSINATASAPGSLSAAWNYSVYSLLGLGGAPILNITTTITSLDWGIAKCDNTTFNTSIINMSFYLEDNVTQSMNATLEAMVFIWSGYTGNNRTGNFTFNDYNAYYNICMNNATNVSSNVYFKFYSTPGPYNRYYWFNQSINAAEIDVPLYVFNYTSGLSIVKITARNQITYQPYNNILAKLQRRYLGDGVYRDVQMGLSDDYGLILFYVIENGQDYRINFYDTENNLLKTSNNLKFSCIAGVCDLETELTPSNLVVSESMVSWAYTYDNNTGLINVTWQDLNSVITSVRVTGQVRSLTGSRTFCNNTALGTSGSTVCNASGLSGEAFIRISKTASPESDSTGFWVKLNNAVKSLGDLMGGVDSAFWSFIIFIVVTLVGLFSIVAAIVMAIVAMLALYALGLFSAINMSILVVLICVGLLLAFKIRR